MKRLIPVRFVATAWRVDISRSPGPIPWEVSRSDGLVRNGAVNPSKIAQPVRLRRAGGAPAQRCGPSTAGTLRRPGPSVFPTRFPTGPTPAFQLALVLGLSALAPRTVAASQTPTATTPYRTTALGLNAGGGWAGSPRYSMQSSLGEVGQATAAPSPPVLAKSGRAGQLFDVLSLSLRAEPSVVPEGSQSRLAGEATLDDGAQLRLGGRDVHWRTVTGPVASLDAEGLLGAGHVYQDGSARVEGRYPGRLAWIDLSVLNAGDDDFGPYAQDGIPDLWQVRHFGESNPAGKADADADGDGQSNLAEFVAGVSPTNAASRFVLEIASLPGEPGQRVLFFSPRWGDRSYSVERCFDLGQGFAPLPDAPVLDFGDTRLVLDPNASGPAEFYRVRISLP
jgi:hypothetical protein